VQGYATITVSIKLSNQLEGISLTYTWVENGQEAVQITARKSPVVMPIKTLKSAIRVETVIGGQGAAHFLQFLFGV